MDVEAISYSVGPLSREYLSKLPHHITPCMNLHMGLLCEENGISEFLFKPFPYYSSLPVPLTPLTKVNRNVCNGIDPTTELIKEKMKWQLKKEKLIQTVCKDKKNISGKVIKKAVKVPVDGKAVIPRGVVLLAQHLDKDPDPWFSGVYNWYYTGGNLVTIKNNEDDYLLHGNHSKLRCTKIVEGNQSTPHPDVDLNMDDPIYQIISNSKGAVVRQKHCINFLSTRDQNSELELKKVHSLLDKKHPFLSVALPENTTDEFCTLSNHGVLKLWDLQYSKKRTQHKVSVGPGDGVTVSDNWSSVQYLDNSTLLMADRCCIHLLDVRAGLKEKQLAWCPKKLMELCEELSHIVHSSMRNDFVYTLTTHQAFALDMRFGFCQRWTHMMAAPPYIGFSQVINNDHEVLCIGSQIMSDCVTIVNTWQGEEPESMHKPSSLPSPAKALHFVRQRAVCLDPTLTQRSTQSMTGLTCLSAEKGLYVLRQSAMGDIFSQLLSSSEDDIEQLSGKVITDYSEWDKPTSSVQQDPSIITVSDIKDFTPFFKAVTNMNIPVEKSAKDPDLTNKPAAWQLSKKYLEDCVDLLAGKLLAVWEVEDEEEWGVPVETDESLTEQDPAEKVLNWLGSANPENNTADERTLAGISTLKPTVTSTPFPALDIQREVSPTPFHDEPSPWMTQIEVSQKHHLTPVSKNKSKQYNHLLSSSSSEGSPKRKKQKLVDSVTHKTPSKISTSIKKPLSSAKKKFIPGF